eukprot:CAMPEP_0181331656 /NCGR_PEP_ID=MMETSP1101-20121128/24630_1 /TAXON_ID=46948 /ORGANISM="Rhodomonas abbreviata, Strain Caron Lab Isolate" /LENGTH=134 /DNA_ID=CAMNT_0023441155 /DNA_START=10 /DNA_END=415 /DNA_ORIENTATION=+
MAENAKRLKIKLGVVKRTTKELASYEKEIDTQSTKVESMKSDGKDAHDIKQQEEVLKEAKACLVDTNRRLEKACDELQDIVDEDGEALAESEDMVEAKKILNLAAETKFTLLDKSVKSRRKGWRKGWRKGSSDD